MSEIEPPDSQICASTQQICNVDCRWTIFVVIGDHGIVRVALCLVKNG